MAAVSDMKTVWIGFMDIVPVIGTVKESVELVLALYEGNKAVIKKKEKALENTMEVSLKTHVKKSTLPDKPAAAAVATTEFSGLKNVTEVRMENIIEYMGKGSKKGTKPSQAHQGERKKRVEDIKCKVLANSHIINPKFNQDLGENLKRSKRGEHVFNNGILKFHYKVLTDFIHKHRMNPLQGYDQQAMDELGRHPLPQSTATEIQTNMVVFFDNNEDYVDANAIPFGQYCRALHDALLVVLGHINPNDVTDEDGTRVETLLNDMNNLQIYVDQAARQKWIDSNPGGQARFEAVRQQVSDMFSRGHVFNWCHRVMRQVEPLFNQRS
ncbi:uncharacterized protein LOC108278447 [Ictalurus punctatus]|uniref:Uncharacterized protein LOC108278447 n=1 Tax=Ictalurus punctatus TaxID=7998 RepID=A0A2D0SXB1_ICTPU|nr:uncharacterized protein LOC108278447 [Ictalurus punctatus]XP_047017682.1 uncharacterized protein LOC108278447 [Ictalurus punctatus]